MSSITKKTLKDVLLNEDVVSDVDLSNLSVEIDAEIKDSPNPVENTAINAEFSGVKSNISLICEVENIFDRILVWNSKAIYYDASGTQHYYTNVETALSQNPSYSGTLMLTEDVTCDRDEYLIMTNRQLTIDLNGHTLSIKNKRFVRLYKGTTLTIRNGKIGIDAVSNAAPFNVSGGKLSFENVKLSADFQSSTSSSTRIFNLCPAYEPEVETHRPMISFDKQSEIRTYGASHGESLIVCLSLFFVLVKSGSTPSSVKITEAQYAELYGNKDYRPQIDFDGYFEALSASADGIDFNAANGSDKLQTVINVGPDAQIRGYNHALYLGNNGVITLNGGYITAKNAITMRSGSLIVPKGANPIVVGTGDFKAYDPIHSVRQGSDAGTNLMLGHAVLLENNGTNYGGATVSADIQSGSFVSLNNTPIAYYCVGVQNSSETYSDTEEPGKYAFYTYTDSSGTVHENVKFHFHKRSDKLGFLKYGQLNRYSSEDDDPANYDFSNGRYPAAGIVASGSEVNGFGYIVTPEPYTA